MWKYLVFKLHAISIKNHAKLGKDLKRKNVLFYYFNYFQTVKQKIQNTFLKSI